MKSLLLIGLGICAATLGQPTLTREGAITYRTSVHVDDCPYKYCGGYVVHHKTSLYRSLADGLQHKHSAHTVREGSRVYIDAEIRGKEDWLRVARHPFIEGLVPPPHCDTTLYYMPMTAVLDESGSGRMFELHVD
jgi:hypothetical protein